jgi:hypothetical protein
MTSPSGSSVVDMDAPDVARQAEEKKAGNIDCASDRSGLGLSSNNNEEKPVPAWVSWIKEEFSFFDKVAHDRVHELYLTA